MSLSLFRSGAAFFAILASLFIYPHAARAQIALDSSFGIGGVATFDFGGAYDDVEGISVASDGKVWAVGTGGTSNRFAVARLGANGQLDDSFSGDGKLIINNSAGAGGVQALPDGKVLLGVPKLSTPRGFQAIRLTNSGAFDSTFGAGGVGFIETPSQVNIKDLLIQPDDKILIGGYDFFDDGWNFVLTRFLASGMPDPDFGIGGRVVTDFSRPAIQDPTDRSETFLQPDGKILAGGFSATTSAESTGNRIHALVRYMPDGTLDPSFGDQGKTVFTFETGAFQSELVGDLALLADGKILGTSNGGSNTALFRLHPNGDLDTTFGTGGRIVAPTGAPWRDPNVILMDSQGRILLGNGGTFSVTRMLPSGVVDPTFGTGGTFDIDVGTNRFELVADMEFDATGNLVIGGYSNVVANVDSNWHVARLATGTPPPVQTVNLVPTFDVKAVPGPTVRSITDGETSLFVGLGFDADNPEERPIFEFPPAGIPDGVTITAATLKLDPYASSGSPRVEVQGFTGDGMASLSDITSPGEVLGTTGPVSASLESIDIDLTPAFIQALLGTGANLGLRLRSLDLPEYVGFGSSEATFGSPPLLSLTYMLPTVVGDFTANGLVDREDLDAWKDAFSGTDAADADDDGDTDGNDFLLWQRQLGAAQTAQAASPVPEPSTAAIIVIAVVWLAAAGRFPY